MYVYFKFLFRMRHAVLFNKMLYAAKGILMNKINDVNNYFLGIYMLCSFLYVIFVRVIHRAIFKVKIEYKLGPLYVSSSK
jgi:hypothetical protein